MKTTKWTEEDQATSLNQGWSVFFNTDTLKDEIQFWGEHDNPPFRTDHEALEFVKLKASKGCPMAIKAIKITSEVTE